jgi:general secretion pathway protein C
MWPPTSSAWTVRGASFALWALAAASALYWGLKLGGGRGVEVPLPPQRAAVAADPAAVARLLGGAPAQVAAAAPLATRFQLVGVVAGIRSGGGAAIIAVDGRPAKSFRVGASVADGVVLQSVHARQAVLAASGDGPALATLELPVLRGASAQAPIAAPR